MSFDWHRNLAATLALIVWLCLPAIGSRVAAAESDFLAGRSKACPNCVLQNASLKRKDLTGADLSGANLSGTVLHRARLARAKFTGTDLTNANLNKTDLKNASLVRAKLSGAMLYETDASAADFTGADLADSKMGRARLVRATLNGANIRNAVLTGARLDEASLRGADLRNANLVEATLRRADLEGANLSNAGLIDAMLRDANLQGANLTDADLYRCRLERRESVERGPIGCTPDQRRPDRSDARWGYFQRSADAGRPRARLAPSTRGIVLAGPGARPLDLEAFFARDRPTSNDRRDDVIGENPDIALRQGCARRQRRHPIAHFGFGQAIAARVRIGSVVEIRHRGARQPALDHGHELIAAELRFSQIGRPSRRLRVAGTVAGPAVTERAVRLFEKKTAPVAEILRRNRCDGGEADKQTKQQRSTRPLKAAALATALSGRRS